MHYYKHHIGDFRSGAANMSRHERWLYRDMLDLYYDKERPLPNNAQDVCDHIGANDDELVIVAKILRIKFKPSETGWVHERCEKELSSYKGNAETSRLNGKLGGRPPKITHQVSTGMPTGTQQEARTNPQEPAHNLNHKPLTNNQEPKKRAGSESRGARLPEDWRPSPEDTAFVKAERPDLRPSEVAQRFYDYWRSVPGAKGRKLDWSATWRNWVRDERPGKEVEKPQKKDWE